MTLYLDASVVVALFTDDANSLAAEALVSGGVVLVMSDFASAEFASAVSRKVRMGELSESEARDAFADFDLWRVKMQNVQVGSVHIAEAEGYLRRLDSGLRAPDAINIAIARDLGCRLATFDRKMAQEAARLGVPT